MRLIKEIGLEQFFIQQQKRIELLEKMLENFNDSRSESFFCLATALLPIEDLENALKESNKRIKEEKIALKDLKSKSKILRENLTKIAMDKSIELKLKKK